MFSRDFLYSIRFRLLASLFLLLGLSIAASMYGIWTYERDRYMAIARKEAMQAGQTIEKALRGAMLDNNWDAIQQSVDDIRSIVKPSVISILSYGGTVAVSSEAAMVGRHFDRDQEASCVVCHRTKGVVPQRSAVFIETEAGPVLRNIIKVPNGPECYGCHPPSQKNCGILVYDVLFNDTIDMLRTVLFRTALTGLVTFVFLILVLSYIVQRYVHRPLHQLMDGFIQVGGGNFNHWVAVEDRGEFQEMADQFNVMSQAIQRSFVEIRGKSWEAAGLYTFVQQLSRAIEWNRLRRLITDLLFDTFEAESVAVFVIRERHERIRYEVSWRQEDQLRYLHHEYDQQVDFADLPGGIEAEWENWRTGSLQSPFFTELDTRVFLPIHSKNVALGLICIKRPDGKRLTGAEKRLLVAVCEQVGIALANARLYRMAITDGLTELYTRRYCETTMRKFIETYAQTLEGGFCVLMIDLDHFKQVNDTYGHQAGDEVLIQLADLIRASIRHDDVACRYGGEEFIVLVSGDMRAGRDGARRLHKLIEEHLFVCDGLAPIHNTASIGLANFPLHGRTGEEVIGAADLALYAAKEQGRNRVVCFEDPII